MMQIRKNILDPTPELVGLVVLALVAILHLTGCGGGALQTHARAALAAGAAVRVVYVAAHDARAAELDACEHAADARVCLDEGEARWAPVVAGYNATQAALESWTSALEVANLAGEDETTLGVLAQAARIAITAYVSLQRVLAPFGIELPDLRLLGDALGLAPATESGGGT